jgi:hypothetical protein
MSTLQVMVNFITFQKAIRGLVGSTSVSHSKEIDACNAADAYIRSDQSSVVTAWMIDPNVVTDHRRVSDIRTFDTRIAASDAVAYRP